MTSLTVVGLLEDPVASYVQAWRRLLGNTGNGPALPAHVVLAGASFLGSGEQDRITRAVDQGAKEWGTVGLHLRGAIVRAAMSAGAQALVSLGLDGPDEHEHLRDLRHAAQGWLGNCLEPAGAGGARVSREEEGEAWVAQDLGVPIAFLADPARAATAARELESFAARTSIGAVVVVNGGCDGREELLTPAPLALGSARLPWERAQAGKAFLMREGMVLLALRRADRSHRHPGAWDGLGGTRRAGESVLAALSRELDEEAGVAAEAITALGCFDDGDRGEAFYVCTRWSGVPSVRDVEEHERLEWVLPARALLRCLVPAARSALATLA